MMTSRQTASYAQRVADRLSAKTHDKKDLLLIYKQMKTEPGFIEYTRVHAERGVPGEADAVIHLQTRKGEDYYISPAIDPHNERTARWVVV